MPITDRRSISDLGTMFGVDEQEPSQRSPGGRRMKRWLGLLGVSAFLAAAWFYQPSMLPST